VTTVKALVLAGGYATRLRPLSCTRPKLLFPVAGKPILEWTMEKLSRNSFDEAIIAVNYMADAIKNHFGDEFRGVKIRYSDEPKPLGTGGPIKNAEQLLNTGETFLTMNGDILSDIDIGQMVGSHRKNKPVATIAVRPVKDPSRFGVVEIDERMQIKRFVEKPNRRESQSNLINAGLYLMEPQIFDYIPSGRKVVIEREVFPNLAKQGKLSAFKIGGTWFDVGKIEDYRAANSAMLDVVCRTGAKIEKSVRKGSGVVVSSPSFIGRDSVIGSDSIVGPYVSVGEAVAIGEGSRIVDSIVFDHVTIGKSSLVQGAILGEGTRVGANAIIGAGSIVGSHAAIHDNVKLSRNVAVCPYKEVEESILQPAYVM